MSDSRLSAPAAGRNREPIAVILGRHLPAAGLVLEIASGSGEHVAFFAERFPDLDFQPSDPDPQARASIDAWAAHAGLSNIRPAIALDAAAAAWPLASAQAILCINMIHIAPWAACCGLFAAAGRILKPGGILYLYGPYRRDGRHTAPSNETFDASLRARNPEWGIRDIEAVIALARDNGFPDPLVEPMPANNLSLIFRKG